MSPAPTPPPTKTTIDREVAKLVCDILQDQMSLDAEHCLLGDQKWFIPADKKLFLVVFDQISGNVGSTKYMDTDQASPTFGREIQEYTALHDVRIEQMSYDNEARVRKEEPRMSLDSLLADQVAEENRLQIAKADPAVDASEAEGAGRLLKFVTHVRITALHRRVIDLPKNDYYNKFNGATVDGTANPPKAAVQD